MPEVNELLKTEVVQYQNVVKFRKAVEAAKPLRVHTFFDYGAFGFNTNWKVSFVDSEGTVHEYITPDFTEDFQKKRVEPILNLLKRAGIPNVCGMIRVSQRDESVYQVFQTDSPDKEERVQASYDEWIDAVRGLPVEGTLVQYLRDGSAVVLDAVCGKSHLVTIIDENSGRTLEATLTKLQSFSNSGEAEVLGQSYATRDNGPVINWYLDMRNK